MPHSVFGLCARRAQCLTALIARDRNKKSLRICIGFRERHGPRGGIRPRTRAPCRRAPCENTRAGPRGRVPRRPHRAAAGATETHADSARALQTSCPSRRDASPLTLEANRPISRTCVGLARYSHCPLGRGASGALVGAGRGLGGPQPPSSATRHGHLQCKLAPAN